MQDIDRMKHASGINELMLLAIHKCGLCLYNSKKCYAINSEFTFLEYVHLFQLCIPCCSKGVSIVGFTVFLTKHKAIILSSLKQKISDHFFILIKYWGF